MKCFRVDAFDNYGSKWFEDSEPKAVHVFLTGSEHGSLKAIKLNHKDLAGHYVGLVDDDANIKQADFNGIATMLAGIPIYGKMLVFRVVDRKAMPFKNRDERYLNRIIHETIYVKA